MVYVLSDKWLLAIKYRIPMIDPHISMEGKQEEMLKK